MVETSPSTSAGAASPTDESTGTARYGVYMRATTAGVRQRLFSRRCDRKYRAQMEARVQRSYSLNVPSVEVRPLPNAQSVATNGPNPRALGLGSGVLLGQGLVLGHAGQQPRVRISTPSQCRYRSPSQMVGSLVGPSNPQSRRQPLCHGTGY